MTQPAPAKHWLTRQEYIRLERAAQARYAAVGDEYRLKPDPMELRHEKMGLSVLLALPMTFGLIGAYGIVYDHWTLEIAGFCGAMPTLFGFLEHLAMHVNESSN
jgi:hypothetical protein